MIMMMTTIMTIILIIELGDIFETVPPSFNFNNVDLQQQQ